MGLGRATPASWEERTRLDVPDSDPDMACPVQRKRPRLEDSDATVASESTEMAAANTRVVLALCGSMSPITFLHLRMFGALNSL